MRVSCIRAALGVVCATVVFTALHAQVRPVYDLGAAGLLQSLQRLTTTASVLHTGAHPDDEDSAFIARTARGDHARVAYLALTRGEGGQNIIGPELFESLGNRHMIGNVLANRSEVCYGRGLAQEGIAQCDLALATYAEIGEELGRGEALRWKAHGLRRLGRHGAAVAALTEAVRIAQRSRNTLLEAESTRELGLVYKADNRPRDARGALQRALELFAELGARRDVDETASEIAKLDAAIPS